MLRSLAPRLVGATLCAEPAYFSLISDRCFQASQSKNCDLTAIVRYH